MILRNPRNHLNTRCVYPALHSSLTLYHRPISSVYSAPHSLTAQWTVRVLFRAEADMFPFHTMSRQNKVPHYILCNVHRQLFIGLYVGWSEKLTTLPLGIQNCRKRGVFHQPTCAPYNVVMFTHNVSFTFLSYGNKHGRNTAL
jgi:hypothetical protein